MEDSIFDNFGGYYVGLIDGTEISRHAPSDFWTEYSKGMEIVYGDRFSYEFVITK